MSSIDRVRIVVVGDSGKLLIVVKKKIMWPEMTDQKKRQQLI